MPTPAGSREFRAFFNDQQIVRGASHWMPAHEDSPTPAELCRLRDLCGLPDFVCLHWLRNRYVQLRKAGKLK